jgi:hypothetical protein
MSIVENNLANGCVPENLATPERPFDEDLENALYTSLGRSHPNDKTGYYTLLRAFQHHIRGEFNSRDLRLKAASDEHTAFRSK